MSEEFYLKVKKLSSDSKIDIPAKKGDAGLDCYAAETITLLPHERYTMPLGICIEFPIGYVCQVNQKSGIAKNLGIDTMGNIIDSEYRGEIHATIVNTSNTKVLIHKGHKICQLIFLKCFLPNKIQYVDTLSETDRGSKGFGSTGV
jgi:dUTP pyrophosphatase